MQKFPSVPTPRSHCQINIRYVPRGQTLTIQPGGRAWLLRGVRTGYPKSETRTYGDPTAPGAARRQREMLVEMPETGWLEFSKNEDGYECPWDLKVTILGPFAT